MTNSNNTVTTITHIAKPEDERCKWFQAEITHVTEANLTDKSDIKYYFKNQDLELTPGTILIDSEAVHYSKNRGFNVQLGLVTEKGIFWIIPNMKVKMFIKAEGHQNLMPGSGDFAAVVRMALYIKSHDDREEALNKLYAAKK